MSNKYYLFLDECGDPDLSDFNPVFPIFTLCGVILSDSQLNDIESQIKELKKYFWGDNKKVILHSRDIRKCQKGFEILFDLNVKKEFYEKLNHILRQQKYTIISCSILKEPYIRKYGRLNDVYAQSLSFIMERTVYYLDSRNELDIELIVDVEKRGKKEDETLLNFYNQILDRGTYFVKPKRVKNYFKHFKMNWKSENITGLQIADLVAYPITRFVLDESAINPAFEIIENNLYREGDKLHGLKVFP